MIDYLQYFEKNREVYPANWHRGEAGLKATQKGISDYLSKQK